MHFLNADDGTRIAWYDYGGDGPNLVLGHATGFCGRIWEPLLPILLPHVRCIAYDLRGHGSSGSPTDGQAGFAWDRYAGDLLKVIDQAGICEPYGLGHSCGGATAVLAEQARPGTYAGLFVFEPVIFPVDPPAGPDAGRDLAIRARKRRRAFASRREAYENFASKGPFKSLAPAALQAYVDYGFTDADDGSVELACDPNDEAAVYVMASAHDGYARLAEVTCPVTVARGAKSHSFSSGDMRLVAEQFPRGAYREYDDQGHFGPLEKPSLMAAEVLAALNIS